MVTSATGAVVSRVMRTGPVCPTVNGWDEDESFSTVPEKDSVVSVTWVGSVPEPHAGSAIRQAAASAARGRIPRLPFLGDEHLEPGRDLGVQLHLHLVLAQLLDGLLELD